MSRIGKQPIEIPSAAKVKFDQGVLTAEGPKGKVEQKVKGVKLSIEDGSIEVKALGEGSNDRAMHGLMRSLVANAVAGVTEGFEKVLEIHGVGYRGEVQGGNLTLSLGYSHPVVFAIPKGIEIEIDKQNRITVRGADRQQVGQVAAELRSLRKPDPYKAKGIRYAGEVIRRKVGKSGVGGAV